MSTSEAQTAARAGRDLATSPPPSTGALRRSAAIRVVVAVLLAAGLTAIAITAQWQTLHAKTDVMGYPIFADFDANNYAHAYYLTVGLFPIAAVLIFLGLTRIGPRVGLVVPPSRGPLRPVASVPEAEPLPDSEPVAQLNLRVAAGVRVAVVGAIVGLAVGVGLDHLWWGVGLVTIGYSLLVALVSVALGRLMASTWTREARLAAVNALGSSLSVVALSLVSAHTVVHVLSNGSVDHYPWFPLWLGVPFAVALFSWVLFALHRGGPARAAVIERRAVLLIAAPVALFVLVAHLQGDSGPLSLYEVGQLLTSTRLVLHGWLPWRDIIVGHGLLLDVLPIATGWGVFDNSYWGAVAGSSVILLPLTIVANYWLLVYLVGRNWPVLLIGTFVFVGTWLGIADSRFLLWPLVLLLFAALLTRFTRTRAVALGILTVVQAIVTPEMAAGVLVVAIVLVAYEVYWRSPGGSSGRVFRRTIWFAIGVVASGGAFAIYMASRGALGDVISVTLDLLAGHFSLGIPPSLDGATQGSYDFIALAPVAALLISFAYAVVMLRTRRPFRLGDWPMAAAALYVLLYYTKFLTRMDLGHAYQPYAVSIPLMVYIVYRAVSGLELWLRSRVPETRAGWLPSHSVGIAALICFVAVFWGPLHTRVQATPGAYRASAADPPIPHVGYAVDYQATVVNDLRRIVNAYLGPHDRLMDITNEPGIFYYFLGRDPSSRWAVPGGGLVDTTKLQHLLIGDLRRERPKLIVFDNVADPTKMFGLAALDGMPNPVTLYLVSRWILRHYSPLLVSHGRTIYALPSVRSIPSPRLDLAQPLVTRGMRFHGQSCLWGDSPTFLNGAAQPGPDASSVPVRVVSQIPPQVTITGWAGDLRARRPAREVIATIDGRIVARAKPTIDRPDVVKAGLPAGFLRTGYQLSIPISAGATSGLRVFAVGQSGSVAELPIASQTVLSGETTIAGRSVTLQPKADTGSVDTEAPSDGSLKIVPPAGSSWANYPWLEIGGRGGAKLTPGAFTVADMPGGATTTNYGHFIAFSAISSSPSKNIIPAASCQQWYGYGSRPLYVNLPPGQTTPDVRLVH